MPIGYLPTGTRGFDCNWPLDAGQARGFYVRGHRFAIRYVGRRQMKQHDVSEPELRTILRAGLAVMLVQHVSLPGWVPDGPLGREYGLNAARFAREVGYQRGAVLWCDLEEVRAGTPSQDVIDYCNAWYDHVRLIGYEPGLYVGYGAGLSGHDLYWRLKFRRYWSAYNLNRDQYPAVRGVQLRQKVATAGDVIPGMSPGQIDVNLCGKDAMGDSPLMMLSLGDR
jgi:hypothetical protein